MAFMTCRLLHYSLPLKDYDYVVVSVLMYVCLKSIATVRIRPNKFVLQKPPEPSALLSESKASVVSFSAVAEGRGLSGHKRLQGHNGSVGCETGLRKDLRSDL